MMDEKMKAAFARRFPVVDRAAFWAREGVEWTLDYLRERQEPVAAQHRFRHPQKTMPDWSVWQPCDIANRPAWGIDSQGWEVEYRALYTHPTPSVPVPEGWPTDDMTVRGAEALHDSLRAAGVDYDLDADLNGTEIEQQIAESVFLAMLAAAPSPTEKKE